MTAESIITVSAACVALVQLCKWSFLPDRAGPIAVLAISLAGVLFWIWTQGVFVRIEAFDYFAGWIAVATSASGVYGFTRTSGNALTKMIAPPITGAGSEPTIKS